MCSLDFPSICDKSIRGFSEGGIVNGKGPKTRWVDDQVRGIIDAEARAAVSEKVIIETERFDATSDYAQKAEWIKNAVRRLEKEAGKPTARKVMQACGMKCCGPTQQKRPSSS